MNDEKTHLKLLIKADKSSILNWRRVLLLSSLFLFMSLLAVSVSVVDYFPEPEVLNGETRGEYFTIMQAGDTVSMNIPKWSLGIFLVSIVGLISLFFGSRLEKRIIYERKDWLASWNQFGTVNYKPFRKKAFISTQSGNIIISKIEDRYLVELPFFTKIEWEKFGIRQAEDDLFSISDKNELQSILHIYFSHTSK